MARMRAAACLAVLLVSCISARNLQQAVENAQATSLAAQNSHAATNDVNIQRAITNTNTGAVTATAIQPHGTDRRTLEQVNADAPTLTDPSSGVSVRPVASSQLMAPDASSPTASTAANTVSAQSDAAHVGVVNPMDVNGASPLDAEVVTGDYLSGLLGVRVATPFFGTGFNFCIGKADHLCPFTLAPNKNIGLLPAHAPRSESMRLCSYAEPALLSEEERLQLCFTKY
jgi:hypothetical protein